MTKTKKEKSETFKTPNRSCPLKCGNLLDQEHLCLSCSKRLAKICRQKDSQADITLVELMKAKSL